MKKLLYILILIPFLAFSQEESRESKLHRFWAQQERKKAEEDSVNSLYYFKNELAYYTKGELLKEYPWQSYFSMLTSCQDIIKLETDDDLKKYYYDTINYIQNKIELLGEDNRLPVKTRISWYFKGNNNYYKKIDSLFQIELKSGEILSNNWFAAYYTNLYTIYNQTKDSILLNRLYSDYIEIVGDSTFIKNYFDKCSNVFDIVFNDSITLNVIEIDFLDTYKNNVVKLNFMVSHLEKNKLYSGNFYKSCLDELIKLESTPENYFKLANFFKINNKEDDYNIVLNNIKTLFPSFKNEINYGQCVVLFNDKKYKSAYNMSLSINGNYKGESLKIAAMSVAALANQSGISTFERKCNYYYAIELLEKSKIYGTDVSNLISQYKNYLPTNQQKFEEGNPEKVFLSTWGVSVYI
jgi:hypothetical protein